MTVSAGGQSLLDRVQERATIDGIVHAVSDGLSGVCVVTGDAGMGKTRMLEYAVESAPQMASVWVAGVEAERELVYAGLHQALRPFFARLETLPEPQRAALETAFGLRSEAPPDRFLVGLAALNLLAEAAGEGGLLCVVDDAQWLDRESLEALSFVARRLEADSIALLFGVRGPDMAAGVLDGLPALKIEGLPEDASLSLLASHAAMPIDGEIARRVVSTTSGCPLALIELSQGLTHEQLLGGLLDSDPLPIGRQLEDHFTRQVDELAPSAQMYLLVAAAESSGEPMLVRRAAFELGADEAAEDAAIESGLIALRPAVRFRHPLVRAAVYAAASRSTRSMVHETLAAMVGRSDPDRRARHLAAAAREPDEALAAELEGAAERAASRGGYAAEVSIFVEAAHLSPDPAQRARRLLRAAQAALNAGLVHRSEALLEQARHGLEDSLLVIDAMRLDGRLQVPLADPPAAPARLLAAAHALEAIDATLARDAFLEALGACIVSHQFTTEVSPRDVARAALAAPRTAGAPTLPDLLLEGTASAFLSEFESANPTLKQVAQKVRDGEVSDDELARWFHLCFIATVEVFDDVAYNAWARRVELYAREAGALIMLQVGLLARAKLETRAGRFAAAEMTYDEVVEVTRMVGGPPEYYEMMKCDVLAWRGEEAKARAAAAPLKEISQAIGAAGPLVIGDIALATLELSLGRYGEALTAVQPVLAHQELASTGLVFPIAIEAASRTDRRDLAGQYLAELERRATPAGTDWALGQLAWCRALLASDSDADELYLEAIARLESTTIAVELAQVRLAYGEWLRRQRRRMDARVPLRAAYEAFADMGAETFASRAEAELRATGENISRRSAGPVTDLTPQEAQVARLAASGRTNAEIAAQMFISASTVDYHLRKVYRKLGIGSRRELADALPPLDAQGAERRKA